MKKFFGIIFTILCLFSFSGCTAQPLIYNFDPIKPWGDLPDSNERTVYSVKYVERVTDATVTNDGETLAEGTLTYELSSYIQSNVSYIKLTSDFSLTFNDNEKNGVNKLLTDTIKSEVHFMKDGLGVVSTEKTYKEAPRKASTDADATFMDTNSYYCKADYIALTAVAKKGQAVSANGTVSDGSSYKEVKEFNLIADKPRFFDNEQFFYAVRALQTTVPSSSISLNISNIYELSSSITSKGKYDNTPFTVSVATELKPVILNSQLASTFDSLNENGEYEVNCMQVSLTKADSLPGPSISLLITDPELEFTNREQKTRKIIVSIRTIQYNMETRSEASNMVYTLTNYAST